VVGHAISYDLAVVAAREPAMLPAIFDGYDRGVFRDTRIREQLDAIAEGRLKGAELSLAGLAKRHLGIELKKADTWRLRYAELDGVPLEQWPEEARTYALEDARVTRDVFLAQAGGELLPDELPQTRQEWALRLMGVWGIRTDPKQIAKVRAELEAERVEALRHAQVIGLVRANGTRNMKAIMAGVAAGAEVGGYTPDRTDTGRVCVDEEAIERAAVALGVPEKARDRVGWEPSTQAEIMGAGLLGCADYAHGQKILGYLDSLEGGTTHALCVRWNNLVDTGRTSCGKDKASDEGTNLQNPHRKGGIRECVVPREGHAFVSVDYDTLEMRTLAQSCIDLVGHSSMAAAINAGRDLHLEMAATVLGAPYEEAVQRLAAGDPEVKDTRQMCKAADFGYPGGMGANSFRAYAWSNYRVFVSAEKAEWLKEVFLSKWPEMQDFFRAVGSMVGNDAADITLPRIGRVTGRRRYCAACNLFFQGPAASGAKEALYRVSRECYARPDSPLYGSRPVLFLHDEIITEVPLHRLHDAAMRQTEIMCEAMQEITPDVKITASQAAMLRWYKDAQAVYVNGRLVPWEPKP
jgi:DNA polymerase-1